MPAYPEIAARLEEVRARIRRAADRAGREAAAVKLVLASKTQPPEAIRAAHAAGARAFGENYVQEAAVKQDALADLQGLEWHLIGHLQMADQVPFQPLQIRKRILLDRGLLHVILAERARARGVRGANRLGRLRLAREHQLDGRSLAPGAVGRAPDARANFLEPRRDFRVGRHCA